MKLNITIDLEDFMSDWGGLDEMIQKEIETEVLKRVKKSHEYKASVNVRTEMALGGHYGGTMITWGKTQKRGTR